MATAKIVTWGVQPVFRDPVAAFQAVEEGFVTSDLRQHQFDLGGLLVKETTRALCEGVGQGQAG